MKKVLLIVLSSFLFPHIYAQDGTSVFNFLKLPISSHAAALGGDNISLIDDDITLASQNPALLSSVTDKTINLNYMNYLDGVGVYSAAFSKTIRERSSWAVTAQLVNYGKISERDVEDNELGEFSAKDMVFTGVYSYNLSDYWSGGVTAKAIYSNYDKYSSFALGVDLGLNYYNQNADFSFSFVARNLGGQLVAFDQKHEKLPIDVLIGFTKRLAHAPFRLSITMPGLTNWKSSPYDIKKGKKNNFGIILLNHFVLGLDFVPTENLYVALGYNCRRGNEMKIAESTHWAGLTLGAGIQIKQIKVGASFAKYHTSSSSLLFNLSMAL
ncbi:MAG: type IX secretion system protein PorQ [Bacteroidaceae bacterium]